MAVAYNPGIVTNGLVLCLDAANRKSYPGTGTGWNDFSGISTNNGTLINGAGYTGTYGGGIVFDGTNDYVSTGLTGIFDAITVECWYRGTKQTRCHLWDFGQYANNTNLNCDFNDTYDLWMFWNGGGNNAVRYQISGSFTDNTLKSLVFTHSGSSNKVFLNTVEQTPTNTIGIQTFSNVNGDPIKKFSLGENVAFGGEIYNVKIYNRALSQTEINQNFNALRGRFGI